MRGHVPHLPARAADLVLFYREPLPVKTATRGPEPARC